MSYWFLHFIVWQVGAHEATWVISDYIASAGSNELSVSKGQQVEIVEPPTANEPDFCVVRLNPQSEDAAVQEGLVPVSILKPPPGTQKTSSTRKDKSDVIQDQSEYILCMFFFFCFFVHQKTFCLNNTTRACKCNKKINKNDWFICMNLSLFSQQSK